MFDFIDWFAVKYQDRWGDLCKEYMNERFKNLEGVTKKLDELKEQRDIPFCKICDKKFRKIGEYDYEPACTHIKDLRLSIG